MQAPTARPLGAPVAGGPRPAACRLLLQRSSTRVKAISPLQQAPEKRPPRPTPGPPLIGNLNKMKLDTLFEGTHQAMLEMDADIIDIGFLGKHTYYTRDPEAIYQMLQKDEVLFAKSQRVARSQEWLGTGIFSQLDNQKHAAMRQTLNPAFRRDYLQQLDSFFVSSALRLAQLLTGAAAAGQAVDLHQLFKRMTLDAIGLTNLQFDFHSLNLWAAKQQQGQQEQQEQGNPGAARIAAAAAAGSSAHGSSSGGGGGGAAAAAAGAGLLDVKELMDDLQAAFMWQSLMLPVPRSWLPGWGRYIAACSQLDDLIYQLMAARKAAMGGSDSSSGSSTSSSGSSSSSSAQPPPNQPATATSLPVAAAATEAPHHHHKEDLMTFLLHAQQQQGMDVISDAQIASELKTMIFGASDTSAFSLAMLCHYLASNPAAEAAAAQEVRQLLQQPAGGPTTAAGRSRGVSDLRAEDAGRLPFLNGCINETMRLSPAGPVVTRTAVQDTELLGYPIPKGLGVCANLYAMHRHPGVWPQPNTWLPERWLPEGAAAGLGPSSKHAFLPFSTGPRACIGRSYALLQMTLTAAVLLGSGLGFEVVQGAPPVEMKKGITMSTRQGIWLRPVVVGPAAGG